MIQYACDRCRCPLEAPFSSTTNSMPTLKEAKRGVEMLLPTKSSVGYMFAFMHLCEPCLSDLAAWRVNPKSAEQALVEALRPS